MQYPYTPTQIERLKKIFKLLNHWIIFVFRSGLGQFFTYPTFAGKVMVIENTGRKSGLTRYAPVNYTADNQAKAVYCLSGFGSESQWYRNIQKNPQVRLWIGVQRLPGQAHLVPNSEEQLEIYRRVLINSGFATPLFEGFNPKTAPEETIRKMAHRAPLIRIDLQETPETTQPRPADFAWIVVSVLLAWGLLRRLFGRKR